MQDRARESVFWPGITNNITKAKSSCGMYRENSPSQPRGRLVESIIPSVPFEVIGADYCQLEGCHYFAVGDRLFTRTEVQKVTPGSKTSRERGVYSALHQNFARFGVPEELSIDCRPEFVVQETQDFLRRWGVKYRLSSAYHPSSNGRAKLAVKSTKRLLRKNMVPGGTIDTDRFL